MSRTYEIVCHSCKVRLWIGQGNPGREYIYQTDEALVSLSNFLFAHQRHYLEFGDDEPMDCFEYCEFDQ